MFWNWASIVEQAALDSATRQALEGSFTAEEQVREMPTAEQVEVAVGTLRMLAEPTRLRILWLLAGVAPSVVSQHLGKLRLARLVTTRRDGNRIFYAASDVHVRQLLEEALFHADHLVAGTADHGRSRGPAAGPSPEPVKPAPGASRPRANRRLK